MRRTSKTTRPERGSAQVGFATAADGRAARALAVRPLLLGIGRATHAIAARPMLVKTALVATGVGVLVASAWISVPFYPVPMTMQTLAVLLVGGLLGPRLGAAAVASYVALGLTGAPVFHSGLGGLAVIAGPTGGYLLGFVPAAFLMGLGSRGSFAPSTDRLGLLSRVVLLTCGAVLAEIVIYALGVSWLALFAGMDAQKAIAVGLVPFLLGDLVKMAVAVTAVYGGRNLLARWGSLPF
jgi:biotin transport system substrate-specific component